MIVFSRELITRQLIEEAMPLLKKHYEEIARFKDIPLDIDIEQYEAFETLGLVRCFVARLEGRILGYANFFVRKHPHFKSSIQALSDILYISPEERGFGSKFIVWCDSQLKAEGIQESYHSVTTQYDFGHLLERIGYMKIDSTYTRRLDT